MKIIKEYFLKIKMFCLKWKNYNFIWFKCFGIMQNMQKNQEIRKIIWLRWSCFKLIQNKNETRTPDKMDLSPIILIIVSFYIHICEVLLFAIQKRHIGNLETAVIRGLKRFCMTAVLKSLVIGTSFNKLLCRVSRIFIHLFQFNVQISDILLLQSVNFPLSC